MMLDQLFQVQDHLHCHCVPLNNLSSSYCSGESNQLACLQRKQIGFGDKIKSNEIRKAKQNHEAIGRFYKMASCNIFCCLFIRFQCRPLLDLRINLANWIKLTTMRYVGIFRSKWIGLFGKIGKCANLRIFLHTWQLQVCWPSIFIILRWTQMVAMNQSYFDGSMSIKSARNAFGIASQLI